MMLRANFHTHSTYCDGKNTLEEMVRSAIEKGMTAIGFSGHAYTPHDGSFCMSQEGTKQYQAEIAALQAKYQDKIDIYCGLELDYFSVADTKAFDYTIGSVHYVLKDGIYHDVDLCEEQFIKSVDTCWGGDAVLFAVDYFKLVGEIVQKTDADIIGHFDLVTKFNEGGKLFDETDPRYVAAWKAALEVLIPTGKLFEVNTGAISRGWRTAPYPAKPILREIAAMGGKVIITSDSHNKDTVDFGFAEAIEYAKSCGVTGIYTLAGRPIEQKRI